MEQLSALPTDGTLVAAVLAGETERFAVLVSRYEGPLLRVAQSRLGRRDWAEDVVQETFLCAFKWLQSYDSQYSFRTWLWTILLNQCNRHHQKRTRVPLISTWSDGAPAVSSEEPPTLTSREATPASSLLAKERAQLLEGLLSRLPEPQGDALRLRFFGGLKFHEIAEAMGCSLSCAKNRVRVGLAKMSEMLTPSSAAGSTSDSAAAPLDPEQPHEL